MASTACALFGGHPGWSHCCQCQSSPLPSFEEHQVVKAFDAIKSIALEVRPQKVAQSYCSTSTVPSSLPTSWALLMEADCSTTIALALAMSSRHPTGVLLNFCFRRLNAQSGENFVWPTSIKLISTLWFRPVITFHSRYCITML